MTRPRWWRYRSQERPPTDWEQRVEADVAASAPEAMVQFGDGPPVPVTGLSIELTVPGPTLAEVWRENFADLTAAAGRRPVRSETVREFLLRTPHAFEMDQGAFHASGVRACACGKWEGHAIHHGETLFATRPYLSGIAAALNERAAAGEVIPRLVGDAPADVADLERPVEQEAAVAPASRWPGGLNGPGAEPWWFHIPVAMCSCRVIGDVPPCEHQVPYVQAAVVDRGDGQCPHVLGNAAGHWRCEVVPSVPHEVHRAGAVEWMGPLEEATAEAAAPPLTAAEAADEDAPETVPLPPVPKPDPLPDGILGYNVASRRTLGAAPGWLMSADLMTREHAEHVVKVTGGVLVEVREVTG